MPVSIRVAVVDDHPLFRAGVMQTLAETEGLQVVGVGATGADVLRIAQDHLPDILLLDVNIPGGGIEAAASVAELCPFVKVVMLTVSERDDHVTAALRAGARGYVLKGVSGPELLNTLLSVQGGNSYVSPALAARLLSQIRRPAVPPLARTGTDLTNREDEVLCLVSAGKTNKEIARELDLSEKTVKHHMTNIMQKLQVRNRVEAVLASRRELG